jgi:drug/metabolite transporter (DMT)-like permease
MIKGVILALSSCFMWGLIFIIPSFMTTFNSFEIALGRHAVFGCVSLGVLSYYSFYLNRRFSWQVWLKGVIFALFVNIVYYTFLVLSVKLTSSSLTALILGMSPILIACYGSWAEKEVNLKKIAFPCFFIALGLACIHLPLLATQSREFDFFYLLGMLGALIALLTWSWYVVANAKFLKLHPELRAAEWATVMGSSTFLWVVFLSALYRFYQGPTGWEKFSSFTPELKTFILGCAILGIFCSWVGAYLWNHACAILPIFGLLFFYILEHAFPPVYEIIGVLLILFGVAYALSKNETQLIQHSSSDIKIV